eukprot:221675-Chlamydomonas_euryale.AAC.3
MWHADGPRSAFPYHPRASLCRALLGGAGHVPPGCRRAAWQGSQCVAAGEAQRAAQECACACAYARAWGWAWGERGVGVEVAVGVTPPCWVTAAATGVVARRLKQTTRCPLHAC